MVIGSSGNFTYHLIIVAEIDVSETSIGRLGAFIRWSICSIGNGSINAFVLTCRCKTRQKVEEKKKMKKVNDTIRAKVLALFFSTRDRNMTSINRHFSSQFSKDNRRKENHKTPRLNWRLGYWSERYHCTIS